MNRRVDIREDIKRYQDTLSYASSKVDYSMGQNIYMLPSDMNLKIRSGTVGYNNKILVSNEMLRLILAKNVEVNSLEMTKISHQPTITHGVMQRPWARRAHAQKPNITHVQKQTITQAQEPTHNEEKIAPVLALAGGFAIWNMFR